METEILRAAMRWFFAADLYMKSIEFFEDRAYGLILSATSDEWLP